MRLLSMEMRKALKNKWFWGMLLLGCVCGFFSFLYRYSVYLDWQREAGWFPHLPHRFLWGM